MVYYYCWARRARERHSPTKYYRSHNFTTEIINNKNVDQPGYSCKYATDPHQTRHQPKFTTLLPMLLKAQQLPTRYAHKMELKEINEFAAYASDGTARNSASLLITLFSALIFMRFRFKWSFVNFGGTLVSFCRRWTDPRKFRAVCPPAKLTIVYLLALTEWLWSAACVLKNYRNPCAGDFQNTRFLKLKLKYNLKQTPVGWEKREGDSAFFKI